MITTIQLCDLPHDFFTEEAKKVVHAIKGGGSQKTQIRSFYNDFLSVYNEIRVLEEPELAQALHKLKLILPRASYQLSRKLIKRDFYIFLEHYIGQINSKSELENFRYFFEAIIGFYDMEGV